MAILKQHLYISEQDYLEGELLTDIKHEYINGEVYAMAGTSKAHSYIAGNIYTAFNLCLKGKICRPLSSDVKVKVREDYFYPDVMVDCSDTDQEQYYTESPTIIVEVLSKSTRQKDKTFKRDLYLTLPTLQEYVLIEQDFVDVEIQRRNNGWQSEHFYLDEDVYFQSVGLTVKVSEIYDRVKNEDMQTWLEKQKQQQQDTIEEQN